MSENDAEIFTNSESEEIKPVKKPLSSENINKFNEKHDKSGVLFMSRVPPHMQAHKVRCLLECYGKIGRIYLAAEDDKQRKKRVKMGGTRRKQFQEAWIEFKDKNIAERVRSNY